VTGLRRAILVAAAVGCGSDDEGRDAGPPRPAVDTRPRAATIETAPVPQPEPPERGPEHVVFDLVDNRLLVHVYQGGGLWADAGSASFARYARPGDEKVGWQLVRRRAGARVAILRQRGSITVPLGEPEAARRSGSIALAVHATAAGPLAIAVNGAAAGGANLTPGWQLATAEVPAGALLRGENRVTFDAGKQTIAVAWIQVGGDPLAAEPAHAAPPPFFDRESRALSISSGQSLVYYLTVPEEAELIAEVTATSADEPDCHLAVRARSQGAEVLGELSGESRVDLDPLAGQVVRVALEPQGCARARAVVRGAALVVPGAAPVRARGEPPRHVLLWIMDTLRADRIRPIEPDARPEVPALERLAAEGAVFRQAYVQGNESQTSHASIWTSLFPAAHGVRSAGNNQSFRLQKRHDTIGQLARRAGLRAIAVTANGMITTGGGYARGFATFVNMMRERNPRRANGFVPGEKILARARQQMRGGWRDPFFLFVGTIDTHKPWVGHEPWLSRYDPEPYSGLFMTAAWPGDLGIRRGSMSCTRVPRARDLARISAIYDSDVSYQDSVLGAMLDEIDRQGIADDTMIIVTADHGEELWEVGRCGHGASLRETLVHVPLIVRYPPLFPPGTIVDEGVDALDILPTLADALGEPPLAHVQGASLVSIAQGVGRGYVRPSYASQYEYAHALRVGTWKMWIGKDGGIRLYDLIADPGEKAPVSKRPIERRFMADLLHLFLANRLRWNKRRWGVVSNMSPQAADELDGVGTHR
jgi:arylsulfatase A-like enzyme